MTEIDDVINIAGGTLPDVTGMFGMVTMMVMLGMVMATMMGGVAE